MRKIIFVIIAALSVLYARSQDDFYSISTINEIRISFNDSNYDQLLDDLYSAGDEERLIGSVEINGTAYDSVGIRYKGNSSYSDNNEKNPLNIKLDHIISNQNHENFEKFRLSNVFKDPSFVREVLGFEIASKYMPVSQANYIKVYINDDYKGLYVNIQDIDNYFNEENFGSDENACFKGDILTEGQPKIWEYLGTDMNSYTDWYELESDEGWDDLIGFLDTLNNYNESVEEVLNVDRHLWMLAFSILTVNLDAPINNAHNYYLSKDEAGQFNPVMWDLNETFGVFNRISGGEELNTESMISMDPFFNENNDNYPIIKEILSNPMYKRMFAAHMKTMIEENFTNGLYTTRAYEIQTIIEDDVKADKNKFFNDEDMITNVTSSVDGTVGISELMDDRCTYILSQSEFTAQQPSISNIILPDNIQAYTTISISAEISNANYAFVKYRHSKNNSFETVELYDDGNHDDGTAGDGVWGTSFMVDESKTHYYIYAENDDAGIFSPLRAQQEYYSIEAETSIEIVNDVVINEFMALNDEIQSDQDGEFDDWIELYNNTDFHVSLAGYYLTDDNEDLLQWAFPDTVILANSYLIVWADKDEEQTGLHANFKLSSSGDNIYLISSDLVIVNEVSFDVMNSDISKGLFPNGVGSVEYLVPSYSGENLKTITAVGESADISVKLFPNPAHDYISVLINGAEPQLVEIYDISRKRILNTSNTSQIDISQLKQGFYIVKVENLTATLIKE